MEKKSSRQSETPKVHQSCDICQTSKIRCGKERPACQRCAKYNLDCVYSMSRRNGRPRFRRMGSITSPAPISRQTSQGSQDIQRQIVPPTPISPVQKSCDQWTPPSELVAPDTSICVPAQSSNVTDTINFSNEDQHVKNYPDSSAHPEIHGQSQTFEPYGVAAVDLTNAIYSAQTFFDDPTNTFQCDGSAFTYTPTLSPFHSRKDTDVSNIFGIDYFGGSSEPINTNLTTVTSSQSDDMAVDSNITLGACSCSTLLIHQLTESASLIEIVQGNGKVREITSYAFALQRSTVLLSHCFSILCCTKCGPKPSSALLLCQAVDEVSVLLGMGTLWGEIPSAQLLCSSNLVQDEVLIRCGTFTVRGADQRALLQTLLMNRLTDMQRVMCNLDKIIKMEDVASSLYQEVYAGIVTELKRKVTSKVDRIKISMY